MAAGIAGEDLVKETWRLILRTADLWAGLMQER